MKSLLILLAACTAKSEDAPKSKSRQFRDLDGPAANAYCQEAKAYRAATQKLPGAARSRCATDALNLAGDAANDTAEKMKAACVKSFTACIAAPPPSKELDCDSNELTANLARCHDLTLDQMTACTEEIRAKMVAASTGDPCEVDWDPKQPAAPWKAFNAKLKGERCALVSVKCTEDPHE